LIDQVKEIKLEPLKDKLECFKEINDFLQIVIKDSTKEYNTKDEYFNY